MPEIQAEVEVVKIKNPDFSYWAWSTHWGYVLSLKSFCWNPVLSWAIRYSVFQLVKFTSSFKFVCRTIFSTFWHLVVKFGYNNWFLSNKKNSVLPFRRIIGEIRKSLFQFFWKKKFWLFFWIRNVISNKRKLEKNFFWKNWNNDFFISPIFPRNGKTPSFLLLKNHLLYPNLTTRCQKVEKIVRQTNSIY